DTPPLDPHIPISIQSQPPTRSQTILFVKTSAEWVKLNAEFQVRLCNHLTCGIRFMTSGLDGQESINLQKMRQTILFLIDRIDKLNKVNIDNVFFLLIKMIKMTISSIAILLIGLSLYSYSQVQDWQLVSDAPSFVSSKGNFPAAKYYIDNNSVVVNEYVVTVDMKQVLEVPLANNAKTIISRSLSINCITNEFHVTETLGYDSNNKLIAREASQGQTYHISGEMIKQKAPLALMRDLVCENSDSNTNKELNELGDQLLDELNIALNKINENKNQKQREQLRSLFTIAIDLNTKAISLREKADRELSKYRIEYYLTAETLKDKNKITNAQDNLIKIRQIINDYEDGLFNINNKETIREKINLIKLDDKEAKRFWDAYEKSHYQKFELIAQYYQVEREIINEAYGMLGFMLSVFKNYYFIGEQIYFEKSEDLEKYNNYLIKIQTLADKESKIIEEISNVAKNDIAQIRSLDR
ncbi:MAG: hypothetical protein AB7I96_11835, partial [Candidatus Dadabacteria bacterium]